MDTISFDLIVIGAGPGGYVAAIRAAQNGAKVALIEKEQLGGACLNVGCIPTKTLLASAHVLHTIQTATGHGISVEKVSFDYKKMKERKDQVITSVRSSLGGLLKANQITIFRGTAEFTSPSEIKVKGENNVVLKGEKIIIATGSKPLDIPAFPCDHEKIFNSTSILELTKLPSSIAIVGGGYIGCEFASLFAALGVKVTILEALPSIVSVQGKEISKVLTDAFVKKGIVIRTGVFVEKISREGTGLAIELKGGESVHADISLIAIGRKIVTEGLKLEKAGLMTDERGAIPVGDHMETPVRGIYAIGDVTGKFMLAHVASHQGLVAADHATKIGPHMEYNAVPAVIFTDPEIATVGLTLEEALKKGLPAKIGTFPFQVLGKSIAAMQTEGFAQIVIDEKTHAILGAQAVGAEASTLIAEMTLAIANELTIECLTETIHAHPTVAEAWLEAALIASGTPVHFPPKRRA